MENTSTQYILVIDTDKYSGNFERELTAFVTGVYGDCGVGDSEAALFLEEVKDPIAKDLGEIIDQVQDERGCYRPCAIETTPFRRNDGYGVHYTVEDDSAPGYGAYESVAIFFAEIPSEEMIDLIYNRLKEFPEYWAGRNGEWVTIKAVRLLSKTTIVKELETDIQIKPFVK